jgi:hypothetical protein
MSKAPIDMMLDGLTWKPVEWAEQPPDDIPHVTHEGVLEVAGFTFRVYQLSDGRRVIHQEDFEKFFGGLLEEE